MTALATIIVVTHNSARWLARMGAALAAQTETRWRLIVVDNASRAEERPHLDALPVGSTLIESKINLGFAEANNRAADEAATPYLVFLNPDAFPTPDWLQRLIAVAEAHPDAGAIGSTQIRADAPDTFDGAGDVLHASGMAYRALYGRPRRALAPLGESFAACAAAMLVRREAFTALGGFDARYFCYFEDVDLCFRLRLNGWRVLQAPDAVVEHVGGGVTGQHSPFADFHGARNRLWTFAKCMPALLMWPLLPAHVALTLAATLRATLGGRGLAGWRGLAAGVGGLGPILHTRGEVQRARTASTFAIARMLAWNPLVFVGRQPVIRRLR